MPKYFGLRGIGYMNRSIEDYIKTIYELGGAVKRAKTNSIAKSLEISAPSASEMVRKLVDKGYVEHIPYKGVILTEFGLKEAIRIKRKHLLWEVFLVEKLGYSWEEVHEEAELLEHTTSSRLEERLNRYLDYPEFCPHGTPLTLETYKYERRTLLDCDKGEEVIFKRVEDKIQVLKYIKNLGLNIGDHLTICTKDEKRDIEIRKHCKIIKLNKDIAKYIYIE